MTKPIPPQETEKIWQGYSDSQNVLQLSHREHPDQLHHCLVWQLLGLRPQGTTEGSAYGPVHHWCKASCHPGPLHQTVLLSTPGIGKIGIICQQQTLTLHIQVYQTKL
jgi:hypothetical protein